MTHVKLRWQQTNSFSDCPPNLLRTEDDIQELLLSLDVTKSNEPDDGIKCVWTLNHVISSCFSDLHRFRRHTQMAMDKGK